MKRMVRKQVYIQPRQEEALKGMSAETGLSEAELIRQGVDLVLLDDRVRARRRAAFEQARVLADRIARRQPPPEGEGSGRGWTREDLHVRGREDGSA